MIKIINPVMIKILSFEIRWYGFFIVSAIIISIFILNQLLKNEKEFELDFFLDFVIAAIPVGIIGARLYYVLFNLDYYLNQPLKILAVNEGGLAIHGGLLAGITVLYILANKREKNICKALDYLAPLTAFSQSIGRWGNFFNQEAYGQIVKESYYRFLPEFIKRQMFIDGYYREATFLYESVLNLLLSLFLLIYLKSSFKKDGEVFSLYLIFYSLFRFFIEEKRTDSLLIGDLQIAKLISLFMMLVGTVFFYHFRKSESKTNKDNKL